MGNVANGNQDMAPFIARWVFFFENFQTERIVYAKKSFIGTEGFMVTFILGFDTRKQNNSEQRTKFERHASDLINVQDFVKT